jgi:hypothetical protein
MKKIIFILPLLISSMALGADAQIDLSWIQRIISMIPTDASTVGMLAIVLEFLLRYIPSAQPLSIVYWVAEFCKQFAQLLAAVGEFLDKIIGQKIQKPASYYNPPNFKK